ncbi:hypothetical protein PBI_CHE9D_63 [Mycobacterium phage Che9d]|uniref:Uncharacterized protein n=1 Tax=Mycobacterium phage Che9d TaxID=2907834 RepID=Q855Q0_9CAUD|nr:hypothetical protein PBI_CHE9D_63 [Mycobacterium phage Che9d]AAN07981.1 hypothetical protein PBI_CHE9D_63 [Mycobacterium phage Che9d]
MNARTVDLFIIWAAVIGVPLALANMSFALSDDRLVEASIHVVMAFIAAFLGVRSLRRLGGGE